MHKLFMRGINTCMKTYTALIKARVSNSVKAIPVEIRAQNSPEARWLLQAIYGFHALVSSPTELREGEQLSELIQLKTPEQQRIANLQTTKDRANDALKAERDRQKRAKAFKALSALKPTMPTP
jgi:hypothetical protein